MYNDEEVARLPSIRKDHPDYHSWKIRERSTKRLVKHVQQFGSSLNILEVGCGNGWLAAKLAAVTTGEVTGMDINTRELLQAKRVFANVANLDFVAADITMDLPDKQFDIIVFAASVHYFSSLKKLISTALGHLTLMGQIHILDSPFCMRKSTAFLQRSTIGEHYVHHIIDLESFQYRILHDPRAIVNRLFSKNDPFYHITIKHHYR